MTSIVREADLSESHILTDISFAAKRYWNYPKAYFEIWKDELTITPEYIQNNKVCVAEVDGRVVGYFSLVEVKRDFWAGRVFVNAGFWLEHIFIQPEYIGRGIGTQLINYLEAMCRELGVDKVRIFSDPNANGFYDKMSARYLGESPSSIEGRTVSLYELDIN
ncbi:hypothetical protein P22_3509 [Propionispora sp. 2/2-37]|uniref:GNAT family N-acetyltransferase n=1 Tax=Propionispora sp. 2/2-37 TaxID=1677858 RepID=UPI0006BB5D9F|nr:GNAT family N-acetyltransferase [Propionispora sp. 2/2-37]CUH97381.1 hypothetical protein P22_3509 [Propionispora sp. 2/2-37]